MIVNENDRFLDLNELCEIIKTKDVRTVIKWCEQHKIPVMFIAKKRMTYRFLVDTVLDRQIIEKFKKQSPDNWEELYRCYRNNDPYGYLMEIQERNREKVVPIAPIKAVSSHAKAFMKDNC